MTRGPRSPTLVERADALYRDYALGAVREWKARTGGLAIGYMPIYVPRELLHAQGVLPVGLMGGARRPRDHPGRRLLPVLHLPHPAQHDRARPERQPRLPRRHDLPGDLRRHPQPVRHVADALPGKLVRYLDVPQNFDPAIGGALLPARARGAVAERSPRAARGRYDADGAARSRSRVYNENRAARARALRAAPRASRGRCRPPSSTSCCAPALVLPVEEATPMLARLPRARRRPTTRASRSTRRACCSPARSASSRRSA